MNFAVFVSEDNGVLREILKGCREYRISGQVSVVIGDRADGKALQEARNERIPAYCIANSDGEETSHEISEILDLYHVESVLVADCRRRLSDHIRSHFSDCICYVVPAASPLYIGTDLSDRQIYSAVLSEEPKESAITVYRLNSDGAPSAIAQKKIRVYGGDTAETLEERMRFSEPEFVATVVADLAEGK